MFAQTDFPGLTLTKFTLSPGARRYIGLLVAASLLLIPATAHAAPSDTLGPVPVGYIAGWGGNNAGQTEVPVALAGKMVTAIAAGYDHNLAVTTDGRVTAWGSDNVGKSEVPAVLNDRVVIAVAAGVHHSLALSSSGQVTGWGFSGQGAIEVPASLHGKTVSAIAAGGYHSLALTSDGRVTAWGFNSFGQTYVPANLAGRNVTAIAAGGYHSLALTSDGQITGWGSNELGQIAIPPDLASKTVVAIAAGTFHSLALTSDGQVTSWGHNGYGQTEVPIGLTETTITAIAAGGYHSLALSSNGHVSAWGDNGQGESLVPESLAGESVTAIAAGGDHNLAILAYSAPRVTVQPTDVSVIDGGIASFSTAAQPSAAVQWQRADPESTSYIDIPDATTLIYTTPTLTPADNHAHFRAVFTNSAGDATTREATLTVTAGGADLRISLTGPYRIRKDANANYTVTVTNAGPSTGAHIYTTIFLPPNLTLQKSTRAARRSGRDHVYVRMGDITAGSSVTYALAVRARARGAATLISLAHSNRTPDPVLSNNYQTFRTIIR